MVLHQLLPRLSLLRFPFLSFPPTPLLVEYSHSSIIIVKFNAPLTQFLPPVSLLAWLKFALVSPLVPPAICILAARAPLFLTICLLATMTASLYCGLKIPIGRDPRRRRFEPSWTP